MSSPPDQVERRRVKRFALRLPASVRERAGARRPMCVIDISTHGCRIECQSKLNPETAIWVYLAHLAAIEAKVVWCRDNFAGLEFSVPLHQAVLDGLLGHSEQLAETEIARLTDISRRSRWLARKTPQPETFQELARLSRDCATSALVETWEAAGKQNCGSTPD